MSVKQFPAPLSIIIDWNYKLAPLRLTPLIQFRITQITSITLSLNQSAVWVARNSTLKDITKRNLIPMSYSLRCIFHCSNCIKLSHYQHCRTQIQLQLVAKDLLYKMFWNKALAKQIPGWVLEWYLILGSTTGNPIISHSSSWCHIMLRLDWSNGF